MNHPLETVISIYKLAKWVISSDCSCISTKKIVFNKGVALVAVPCTQYHLNPSVIDALLSRRCIQYNNSVDEISLQGGTLRILIKIEFRIQIYSKSSAGY